VIAVNEFLGVHTMATLAQIEALEARRAKLAQSISQAKQNLHKGERKAEDHVKLALGGAVLAFFGQENCPATIRHFILTKADQGVQKQGLGREKFEALKARFTRKSEE
jgi:CHASE1-domain containing sensor protein